MRGTSSNRRRRSDVVNEIPAPTAVAVLEYLAKSLVDDPEAVRTLATKFYYSQQFMQDDPWAKRAAGEDSELHQHLAEVRPLEFV